MIGGARECKGPGSVALMSCIKYMGGGGGGSNRCSNLCRTMLNAILRWMSGPIRATLYTLLMNVVFIHV